MVVTTSARAWVTSEPPWPWSSSSSWVNSCKQTQSQVLSHFKIYCKYFKDKIYQSQVGWIPAIKHNQRFFKRSFTLKDILRALPRHYIEQKMHMLMMTFIMMMMMMMRSQVFLIFSNLLFCHPDLRPSSLCSVDLPNIELLQILQHKRNHTVAMPQLQRVKIFLRFFLIISIYQLEDYWPQQALQSKRGCARYT